MNSDNRGWEDQFKYYMDLIEKDHLEALAKFTSYIESQLAKARGDRARRQLTDTLRETAKIKNEEGYAYGAGGSQQDAVKILISNHFLRRGGFGVLSTGPRESVDIVSAVAEMITEDIHFVPMTRQQKRVKMLAESYGLTVYLL